MSLDSLHTGKTISLTKVSQLLAKKDDDYPDLQWTLRYCLEKYIKVCIKIVCNVLVWEREEGNYKNNACGKCSEISKEREKLIDQGKDEEEQLPSYCTDCHMTSPPMMGKGDYIRNRNGIFFINREDMEQLINHDSINVDRFYVIDYVESGESSQPNYKQVEVASDREWYIWSVEKELADENPDLAKQLLKEYQDTPDSDIAYVEVKISDIYCWKEDVERTLTIEPIDNLIIAQENQDKIITKNGDIEQPDQDTSIATSITDEPIKPPAKTIKNRDTPAHSFIQCALNEYKKQNSNSLPLCFEELFVFCRGKHLGGGYKIREKNETVFLHPDDKSGVHKRTLKRQFDKAIKNIR